jgi:hypothetical protein
MLKMCAKGIGLGGDTYNSRMASLLVAVVPLFMALIELVLPNRSKRRDIPYER